MKSRLQFNLIITDRPTPYLNTALANAEKKRRQRNLVSQAIQHIKPPEKPWYIMAGENVPEVIIDRYFGFVQDEKEIRGIVLPSAKRHPVLEGISYPVALEKLFAQKGLPKLDPEYLRERRNEREKLSAVVGSIGKMQSFNPPVFYIGSDHLKWMRFTTSIPNVLKALNHAQREELKNAFLNHNR